MPAKNNKEILTRIYKIFETGEFQLIDKYIDEHVLEHTPDPSVPISSDARDYYKNIIKNYRVAFPDIKVKFLQLIEEGDKVVALVLFSGTNTGPIMWMEPTHKRVQIECFDLSRFKDGRIIEHWSIFDNYSLLHQLGVLPDQSYIHAHKITAANEENITES